MSYKLLLRKTNPDLIVPKESIKPFKTNFRIEKTKSKNGQIGTIIFFLYSSRRHYALFKLGSVEDLSFKQIPRAEEREFRFTKQI